MQKRGGRKAQITLFVIIALVIVIVFLIIYFVFLKKPAVKEEFKREAIPEEFKPVRDYVESCIHKVGIEAIKKMGAHGGYIDPLDAELTPIRLRFSATDQTMFELASITGDSDDAVPYYLYVPGKSSYLNYQLGSVAPTIESMNYQLAVYMNKELPKCTADFQGLKDKGFTITPDINSIFTNAFIRDDNIEFFVTYNINVSKEGAKTEITKHQSTILFPYKKYYDLALSMMTAELFTQFLESFTNSMITYYSGLDFNRLPPVVEYSNDPYIITWSNSKVRNDLNDLLLSYTSALQVIGTKNYEPITVSGNDVESNFFKSLSMEIFNDTLPNTSITFFYIDNGMVSKVHPSKGDLIRPNVDPVKGNQFIPASQFNTYKFYYDVAYPVMVEIRGYELSEIPEYSFLFALETNLIENKGVLAWNIGMGTINWDYSYINTTVTTPEGSFFDSSGKAVDVKPRTITKSLFCDEDTWLSGDVSLKAVDATTGKPLDGVSVSYGCGDYDECWVGNTEIDGSGNAKWTGKLPLCTGGYLTLAKDGYGSKNIMLSTQEGQDVLLGGTQKLDKIREINATIKKFEIQKVYTRADNWSWQEGPDSLGSMQDIDGDVEQVILTITQTGFEAGTNPISNSIIFGKEGVTESTIRLVPGEYEVTATLIDHNGIKTPANCSRVCKTDVIVCLDYEYYPADPVELKPSPWGGIEIKETTTGFFTITADQLDNNQEVEFRVLKLPDLQRSIPPGACIEALEEMNKIGEYSIKYSSNVLPVFK